MNLVFTHFFSKDVERLHEADKGRSIYIVVQWGRMEKGWWEEEEKRE